MGAVLPQVDRGNGVCEVAIGFGDLALERAAIVAGLGYLDGAIPEHFAGLLDSALAQAAAAYASTIRLENLTTQGPVADATNSQRRLPAARVWGWHWCVQRDGHRTDAESRPALEHPTVIDNWI